MTKIPFKTFFALSGILTILLGNCNFVNYNIYAHNFTPNESATFVAFTYQLQVESELVKTSLLTNNISSSQNHANKAVSLLTANILAEIVEKDPEIANDLRKGLDDLLKISTSIKDKQQIDNVLAGINSTLTKAVDIRLSPGVTGSPSFLERADNILRGFFQSNPVKSDVNAGMNSTIQALSFADLVDSVLINYGNAFGVEFDMTNMSNMAMTGANKSSSFITDNGGKMNMDSMNMSSGGKINMNQDMNRTHSLIDMSDYESAQALSKKAYYLFNYNLGPLTRNANHTGSFVTELKQGLTDLETSVNNKDSPMDVMSIAHTQIHPNLLAIFNLDLREQ